MTTTMPTTEELTALERLAERLYKGKAFPDTVRSVDTAFAILLKGWELGMPAMAAAAGIAWINAVGNLGGHFGPDLVGRIRSATGSANSAFLFLAALAVVGAVLTLFGTGARTRTITTPNS